jgi:hypothetical protein
MIYIITKQTGTFFGNSLERAAMNSEREVAHLFGKIHPDKIFFGFLL